MVWTKHQSVKTDNPYFTIIKNTMSGVTNDLQVDMKIYSSDVRNVAVDFAQTEYSTTSQ